MSRFRFCLLFLLFLTQMLVNAFQINYWPLTDYPMFASPRTIDNVRWFSLNIEFTSGINIPIPIHGGAAVMNIYTEAIKKNDFIRLKSQIFKDLDEYGVSRIRRHGGDNPRIVLQQVTIAKGKFGFVPVRGAEIFSLHLEEKRK